MASPKPSGKPKGPAAERRSAAGNCCRTATLLLFLPLVAAAFSFYYTHSSIGALVAFVTALAGALTLQRAAMHYEGSWASGQDPGQEDDVASTPCSIGGRARSSSIGLGSRVSAQL